MAVASVSIISERWLDEVVLTGNVTNTDGDVVDTFTIPDSLGDLAFMEGLVEVGPLATAAANIELMAARIIVTAGPVASALKVDFIGQAEFRKIRSAHWAAYFSPDPLVLVRAGEHLQIVYPELDTNATPTADPVYTFKFVRVRPQEVSEQPRPLRLVR